MMPRNVFVALLTVILALGSGQPECWAKAINVPGDAPTIQAGINAASNGDSVEVAPGIYKENINFNGKLITVTSSDGPMVTTIDGGNLGPVVTFISDETNAALLSGFAITNGMSTFDTDYNGGGIFINNASPTISGNVITNNGACGDGAGIAVESGSPLIEDNTISNNNQSGCSGGGGGGISLGKWVRQGFVESNCQQLVQQWEWRRAVHQYWKSSDRKQHDYRQ